MTLHHLQLLLPLVLAASTSYDLDDPAHDHREEAIRRDEAGDSAGALASFRAAVRFDPGTSEAWNNLGICLLDMSDEGIDEAVRCFRTALTLQPRNSWARDNLERASARLIVLKRREQHPEAFGDDLPEPSLLDPADLRRLSSLRKAVRKDPDDSDKWHALGLALMETEGLKTEEPYRFVQAAFCFSQAMHHDSEGWVQHVPSLPVPVSMRGSLGAAASAEFERVLRQHSVDLGWSHHRLQLPLVTMTMSTEAHLPLLKNMLSSFEHHAQAEAREHGQGQGQERTGLPAPLVFALDEPTAQYCRQHGRAYFAWHEHSVGWRHALRQREWTATATGAAGAGSVSAEQALRGTPRYWSLLRQKPQLVYLALTMGLAVLWVDTDVAILRDPLAMVQLLGGAGSGGAGGGGIEQDDGGIGERGSSSSGSSSNSSSGHSSTGGGGGWAHLLNCDADPTPPRPSDGRPTNMGTFNTGLMLLAPASTNTSTSSGDGGEDDVWRDVIWATHLTADPFKYEGPETLDDMYYYNQAVHYRYRLQRGAQGVRDGIVSGGGTSRCLPAAIDGNRCRLQQHRRDHAEAAAPRSQGSGPGLLHLHAACTKGADEKRAWLGSMGHWHPAGGDSDGDADDGGDEL